MWVDLPASSIGGPNVAGAVGMDALRSRMEGLGIGTVHNTLANEEQDEEEKTTGASSSNQDERDRQMQLS